MNTPIAIATVLGGAVGVLTAIFSVLLSLSGLPEIPASWARRTVSIAILSVIAGGIVWVGTFLVVRGILLLATF